jgi:hypothetical protein
MPACDQVSRQAAIERLRRTLRVAPDFTDAIAELMISYGSLANLQILIG